MGIFDLNGQFMDALRKFSDIVFYNILFCIFSLPIITAGAALTALCEGVRFIAAGEDSDLPVFKTFLSTFKRSFKRVTPVWLIVIFAAAALASMRYGTAAMPQGMSKLYGISFYFFAFLAIIGYQFLFPLLAYNEDLKGFGAIKRSYLFAVAFLPYTLIGAAGSWGFFYLTMILNNNAFRFGIFLWASCAFGISAYLNSFLFLHITKKLRQRQHSLRGGQ